MLPRFPALVYMAGQSGDFANGIGRFLNYAVAGLIHDIPTVKELIDRTMTDAERIIRGRLEGMLGGTVEEAPARAA